MSVETGRQLGPYVIGERLAPSGSGEWFSASEAALERPVSVLVSPLPADGADAETTRDRARRISAISDARLLPIYGRGEDGGILWLTTRQLTGQPLTQLARLDEGRAARIGSQLARQLAALAAAGAVPDRLAAESVVVEGSGEQEHAWLLPDLAQPTGGDPTSATQSLVQLLDGRVGRPLLESPPDTPDKLAEQLDSRYARRRSRRGLVVGACVLVAAAAAALLAVLLLRDPESGSRDAPVAAEAARIPLGSPVSALAANDEHIWAITPKGELVHVDVGTESVVGAPLKLLPPDAWVDLVVDGASVWAGGPGVLLELDAETGRVLQQKRLGQRALSGLLPDNGRLWATFSDPRSPVAEMVRFEQGLQRETAVGPAGAQAVPVAARDGEVWALGGEATLRHVDAEASTIGLGLQAGFPAEHEGRLWIPTRADRTIVVVDPETMEIERTLNLDGEPWRVVAGGGSIWALTQPPSRIFRIDPETGALLGRPFVAPEGARNLRFAAGSLWVDDPNTNSLLRLTPTSPPPEGTARVAEEGVLHNGPVPVGARVRVSALEPQFSIRVDEDDWFAEGVVPGSDSAQLELFRERRPGLDYTGVSFARAGRLFSANGRLVRTPTPDAFLRELRRNPSIEVRSAAPATVGGRRGLRVRFATVPKPPFPELCQGAPCVPLFPVPRGTFILLPGIEEFTMVKDGQGLFIADATLREGDDPRIERKIQRLIDSIRFEP